MHIDNMWHWRVTASDSSSKSFSTCDRQETVWLCAVSSCLTVAPRFLFFFMMKKRKKNDDRHRRHNSACERPVEQKKKTKKKKTAEPKAAARGTFSGCSFCIWRPELCVLKLHVTVTACAPLPSIFVCFFFAKRTASMLARNKKKRRFLYRSEERKA